MWWRRPVCEFDPLDLRHVGISFSHAALNFDGASHGVDDAGELNESTVPGILDDASAMLSDYRIEKRLSKSFQLRQVPSSSIPIKRQEPATSAARIAASRRSTCSLLKMHPRAGEIECLYSRIVGRCPAMPMSETGPERKSFAFIR
jgi:hypothetical protein